MNDEDFEDEDERRHLKDQDKVQFRIKNRGTH